MADERIAAMLGGPIARIEPVGGGFTHTRLSRVFLADGHTVVIKAATDERTAEDVRYEHGVLARCGLDFMPRVVAFSDADPPLLALEDLSSATSPPPWPSVEALFRTVERLGEIEADSEIWPLRDEKLPTWESVMEERAQVARLGGLRSDWLELAAPVLAESAARATVEGSQLLHADIWSSNICFADRGVVLIDWAGASRGNADFDKAIAIIDMFVTTGRLPAHPWGQLAPMAAVLAAMKCNAVTLGRPDWAAEDWHETQVQDLRPVLTWAAHEHGLPPP